MSLSQRCIVTRAEILDDILLSLADAFEASNRNGRTFTSNVEEYAPLRECIATLIAEGSLTEQGRMGIYRLTPQGYLRHKARIDALRVLPR